MALPNSNISISMVRNELGESSNDLSVLCKSDKINKWSKWKPQILADITATQQSIDANRWGLSISRYSSPQLLYSAIQGNADVYQYHKPTSIFRLGDFRNYQHSAPLPIGTGKLPSNVELIKKGAPGYSSRFHFLANSLGGDYDIGLDDIKLLTYEADLYPCVILKNGSNYRWTSASDIPTITWGDDTFLRTHVGSLEVYLCFSTVNYNNAIRSIVTDSNEYFYPFPSNSLNSNPYPISVDNGVAEGSLKYYVALYDMTVVGSRVNYNISFRADRDEYSGGTINNVFLELHRGRPTGIADPIATRQLLSGAASVTKLVARDYSGSLNFTGSNLNIWFRIIENGNYVMTGMVLDENIDQ